MLLVSLGLSAFPTPKTSTLQVIPVPPSVEGNTVVLRLALPENREMVSTPVEVQFRIDGFALGVATQFERADEIQDSDLGQTVHVIIDNHPYIAVNEPAITPYGESTNYYNTSYRMQIPFHLKSGEHIIRMFPARSYGESLKGDQTFVASQFFVGNYRETMKVNLNKPYLTYNEPSPNVSYDLGVPILLDFYISNAELSPDGYKVRLTINDKYTKIIDSWQPYYIFGLKKGLHDVRLELLDQRDKKVPGDFNDVTEKIRVVEPAETIDRNGF